MVAALRNCGEAPAENSAGQQGIARLDASGPKPGRCWAPRAPIRKPPSSVSSMSRSGEPVDVDNPRGRGNIVLHQVYQIGTAGQRGHRELAARAATASTTLSARTYSKRVHCRSLLHCLVAAITSSIGVADIVVGAAAADIAAHHARGSRPGYAPGPR